MTPKIETLKSKKLIGIRMEMSLAADETMVLWQKFMPRRGKINNRTDADYISMQNYGDNWAFHPRALFEKWAAVEVDSFAEIPAGMESYVLGGGKYAVFIHRGPASTAGKTIQYIFKDWLPISGYILDIREHFEKLPEGYDPTDPAAEEEIWIPVRESDVL